MPITRTLYLLACLLITGQVKAGVASRDLFEPGDGLLTYDNVNQREWLDFNYSASLGRENLFAEVVSDGAVVGFKFATRRDVEQLAVSAGASWIGTPYQQLLENSDNSVRLMELLDWTFQLKNDVVGLRTFTGGQVAVGDSVEDSLQFESSAILLVLYGEEAPDGNNHYLFPPVGVFSEIELTSPLPLDLTGYYWLYRDAAPAPEPAAAYLLLAALLGGAFRRLKPLRLRASA